MPAGRIHGAGNRAKIVRVLDAVEHDQQRRFVAIVGGKHQVLYRDVPGVGNDSYDALVLPCGGLAVQIATRNAVDLYARAIGKEDDLP